MLFQQQTSKNYEYAHEHQVQSNVRIQCINCGDLIPFKIVTVHPNLTSFFCEPSCRCTEESTHAEI